MGARELAVSTVLGTLPQKHMHAFRFKLSLCNTLYPAGIGWVFVLKRSQMSSNSCDDSVREDPLALNPPRDTVS